MRCAADGVPELIQSLEYRMSWMGFDVVLFDGRQFQFSSDEACPSIGLMQCKATRMQMLEAQNYIEKYALAHFFPRGLTARPRTARVAS